MDNENSEKAMILKESLKIVDKLGDMDDDYIMTDENDYIILEKLIKKAKELKRNKNWKL